MSYISPNGEVIFLEGIRIDKKHNHTIRFNSVNSQTNFFRGKQKRSIVVGDKEVYFAITDQTYTRVNNGVMKVAIPADYLRSCNYMMFRNTAYSGKWFYAFIDNVEYNNNSSCYVTFSIDLIQTWWFDFDMTACFVEREHSETDAVGDNIVPENLETGEYVYVDNDVIDLSKMSVAVLSTENPLSEQIEGSMYNGVYSGLYHKTEIGAFGVKVTFDTLQGELSQLNSGKLRFNDPNFTPNSFELQRNSEDVVLAQLSTTIGNCILRFTSDSGVFYIQASTSDGRQLTVYGVENGYQVDGAMESGANNSVIAKLASIKNGVINYEVTVVLPDDAIYDDTKLISPVNAYLKQFKDDQAIVAMYQYPSAFDRSTADSLYSSPRNFRRGDSLTDGYVPKNNKLFTSPYNKVVISNNCGGFGEFLWEFTENKRTMQFQLYGSKYGTPCCLLTPYNYKGKLFAYDDGLALSNFPVCSWRNDVFKTWWNQNKTSFMLSTITGAVQGGIRGGVRGAKAGPVGAVVGAVAGTGVRVMESVAKTMDVQAVPDQASGQIQCETLNVGLGRVGYTIYYVSLQKEMLQVIDDYFSMYGYATKRVKVPNIKLGVSNIRPLWNYIETKNCCVVPHDDSGLSASDIEGIQNIFDGGITFWASNDIIGDYSLNNSPIGG